MRRMQGFTLLETLAAISLLGLLMLLVAGSFTSSGRTLQRTSEQAARLEQLRAAQGFLRRALQEMQAFRHFHGEPRHMQFLAPVPIGIGGQLKRHRLTVEQQAVGTWAMRVTLLDRDGRQPWADPQLLFDRLREVRFAYRGLDEMRRDTGWLERWPWPERLPAQVRIQADAEGSVRWPTLSVSVRTSELTGIDP
ncbi:prepilin-type N-terminal cleavage/methylation domain-containing protein [Pseudomonas sp. microsymbiont 2]